MIDPRGLSIQQWFDAVIADTGSRWAFGRLDQNWQDYAVGFVRAFPLTLPDPYQFADWREWAMRVAPMMEVRQWPTSP